MIIEILVLIFFVIISIIDLKYKSVPAIFTTGAIFLLASLKFPSYGLAILSFIFAWFLIESEFFSGIADLKAVVIIGLILPSLYSFFLFILLILFYGLFYKVLMKKVIKQKKETAFMPVFFFVYLTLLLVNAI